MLHTHLSKNITPIPDQMPPTLLSSKNNKTILTYVIIISLDMWRVFSKEVLRWGMSGLLPHPSPSRSRSRGLG